MFVSLNRLAICALSLSPLLLARTTVAQSPQAVAASRRIAGIVDSSRTTPMQGLVPAWASVDTDLGALDPGEQLDNLHLILSRAPEVEAAFEQLLQDQQNPASSRYHQWLTPEQNAQQFGIAPADLATITNWLQGQGLTVTNVTAGGVIITFSGSARAVQNAFSTTLHKYNRESGARYAPSTKPMIPTVLAGVVSSVSGLSEEVRVLHSRKLPVDRSSAAASSEGIHPATNFGSTSHYLSPGDFNLIYNITPALNAGITGSGYRIAVIMSSNIVASDITNYQTLFGVTAAAPVVKVVPGQTDPGTSNTDAEGEADLDVQRAMGTAPGAGIDLLVIRSLTDTNIIAALNYEISTVNDASVNMSFGGCNTSAAGVTEATTYDTVYRTASAQGISIFNSSGDTGAAGCDTNGGSIPATQVQAANILCMSSYVTCVGGTEFADTAANWSSTNSATWVSALGYIPEGAWNEPTVVSSGVTSYQATASGGGPGLLSRPTWQPNSDTVRDTPDLAFTASDHNGFLICQADSGSSCSGIPKGFGFVIGGTSAAAPSMAAIATLLDQKLGARQGNLNPLLYQLAAGASSPFHDVTVASSGVSGCVVTTPSMCNNSTPAPNSLTGGLSGFLVGPGYDEVTGLGSLDVNAFLTAASATATPTFTVVPATTSLTLAAGATTGNTDVITLTSVSGFAGSVALTCKVTTASGTASGTCSVSPTSVTLAAGGTGTSTLTVLPGAGAFGVLNVTVTGTAGATVVSSSTITVNVSNPAGTFTLTPASSALTFSAGAATGNSDAITVASTNGFAGTVSLSCVIAINSGTASVAPTCAMSPASVSLSTTSATATSTASIGSQASSTTCTTQNIVPALPWKITGEVFTAFALVLIPMRKRRFFRSLLTLGVLALGMSLVSGCGGGGNAPTCTSHTIPGTTAGVYTVTVTGISGSATVTKTFAVTIQ